MNDRDLLDALAELVEPFDNDPNGWDDVLRRARALSKAGGAARDGSRDAADRMSERAREPDRSELNADAAEGEEEPADLYVEGGVVTSRLPVAPPEQGAEDAVRLYLRSIGRVPLLAREDEVRLAKRIEANDMSAKNSLIEANLRLVVSSRSATRAVA